MTEYHLFPFQPLCFKCILVPFSGLEYDEEEDLDYVADYEEDDYYYEDQELVKKTGPKTLPPDWR